MTTNTIDSMTAKTIDLGAEVTPDVRLVALASWENNGYDDSDGYTLYYIINEDRLVTHLSWTTRFAGRSTGFNPTLECPSAHLPAIKRHWVEEVAQHRMKQDEVARTCINGKDVVGQSLVTVQDTSRCERMMLKCPKCIDGFWMGKKSHPCFACNGRGFTTPSKSKARVKIPAGTKGYSVGSVFDLWKDTQAKRYHQESTEDILFQCELGLFIIDAHQAHIDRPALTHEDATIMAEKDWDTCSSRGDILARLKGMRAWSDYCFD